ncbi:hypothetical protein OF83DRAFT_1157559 [Amylostereum chailletii]|nr:hypothetical protein OF83DRAFT_1157559 [Amylostereum chailletii]
MCTFAYYSTRRYTYLRIVVPFSCLNRLFTRTKRRAERLCVVHRAFPAYFDTTRAQDGTARCGADRYPTAHGYIFSCALLIRPLTTSPSSRNPSLEPSTCSPNVLFHLEPRRVSSSREVLKFYRGMSSSGPTPTPPPSASPDGDKGGGNKNKFIVIIVSCIGGFAVALILVLVLVPFLRRYARRRQSRDIEGAQDRGLDGAHGHDRSRSGSGLDSSAPLLSGKGLEVEVFQPYPTRQPEREREALGGDVDEHAPSTENSDEPLTPVSAPGSAATRIYNPWTSSATSPSPAFPRSLRPSSTVLKRARPRIGQSHTPMEPLPENSLADPTPIPSPSPVPPNPNEDVSPLTSPTSSQTDSHPSWLHVPKPLISAFRKSLGGSSVASSTSSLPAMQHYPSFNASSVGSSGERSRSPETFHSFSSASMASAAVSHAPVSSPVNPHPERFLAIPAKLKPSGGSEHVATVQRVSPSALPSSRAASFLGGVGSVSSVSGASVYVDARSRLDEDSVGGRSR